MKSKIVGILVCTMLITTFLTAAGTLNDNKTSGEAYNDYGYSVQQTTDRGHFMTDWLEQAKLTASDGTIHDCFAYSVSIDGYYVIIGAHHDDSLTGSAYIFKRTGTTWTEEAKLTASDGAADDRFGWSVSIDGDYAIVGAYNDDSGTGSAYVFTKPGADVPTWKIYDTWTYKIKDINIDIEENKTIHAHLEIEELALEVVDDTGDSYDLELKPAKISGDYSVYIEQENATIDVEGKLIGTKIEGNIIFRKSDLGIKEIDAKLSGILTIKINEIPEGLPFSNIPFPIPVPATIDATVNLGDPYVIIDFPLNTGKMWGLSATNFSLNGEVRSIWFNIIKFIDQIATAFGLQILPPEISELLPVIDIKDALEMRGMTNIFEIPEIPSIFSCFNMENITVPTVPPETFNAYNISIVGGLGRIYYAPEVKNIIKISGQLGDLIPFIADIDMELIDYDLV